MDDRAVVERQLGRPPRAFGRVVVRCPFGLPAVTEQEPYDSDGRPFPTTYYVTCPHLVSAIARLEAAGGVERWSDAAAADEALRQSLEPGNERATRESVASSPVTRVARMAERRSTSGSAARVRRSI